ncbi:toxin-antitoxin system YwqK family antitoxin [Dokdonia sp. Asnod3-C12]|uniref:toxin-antitoxin system YwqK family antitoxin n=1 Tax=Dokdonia sp. Asnod3-C12 TaxID=3160575 RepID=UPI00386E33A6
MTAQAITTILLAFIAFSLPEPRMYSKLYHDDGTIQAEGWIMGEQKVKYWKFYHENGTIAAEGHYQTNKKSKYWHYYDNQGKLTKEGHYEDGIAQNWWIFYDLARQETRKSQYVDNHLHGYCLVYKNKKLFKVEKYEKNQLKGAWTSIRDFRRDNPDVSLY